MNFNWVTKNIALGTEFQEYEIPYLVNSGFGAVLDLRAEACTEARKLRGFGLVYKRIPVMDNCAPSLNQYLEGIVFLDSNINNGDKVYVHCKEGRGRSATMVIAYLIKSGMAPIDAYQLVKERREEANPTLIQVYSLKQFERVI